MEGQARMPCPGCWADEFVVEPDTVMRAEVWECDDTCLCAQAQIVSGQRTPAGGMRVDRTLWRGEYHIEWEGSPTTELNREARRLRKHHNELFHRISWPWDRKSR